MEVKGFFVINNFSVKSEGEYYLLEINNINSNKKESQNFQYISLFKPFEEKENLFEDKFLSENNSSLCKNYEDFIKIINFIKNYYIGIFFSVLISGIIFLCTQNLFLGSIPISCFVAYIYFKTVHFIDKSKEIIKMTKKCFKEILFSQDYFM